MKLRFLLASRNGNSFSSRTKYSGSYFGKVDRQAETLTLKVRSSALITCGLPGTFRLLRMHKLGNRADFQRVRFFSPAIDGKFC